MTEGDSSDNESTLAPEGPQPCYPAEPRSFTGWLAVETVDETEQELLNTMTLITESFDELPATATPAARNVATRHLVNQALGSQDFSAYLTVLTVDGGERSFKS
jgi:hypothetical protein